MPLGKYIDLKGWCFTAAIIALCLVFSGTVYGNPAPQDLPCTSGDYIISGHDNSYSSIPAPLIYASSGNHIGDGHFPFRFKVIFNGLAILSSCGLVTEQFYHDSRLSFTNIVSNLSLIGRPAYYVFLFRYTLF